MKATKANQVQQLHTSNKGRDIRRRSWFKFKHLLVSPILMSFCFLLFTLLVASMTMMYNINRHLQEDEAVMLDHSVSKVTSKGETHGADTKKDNLKLISCNNIHDIEVLQVVGQGNQKIVFEVKLPTGEIVLGKRCINIQCVWRRYLQNEAFYLKKLQQTYGRSNAIGYYGECDIQVDPSFINRINPKESKKNQNSKLHKIKTDLNGGGLTIFVEKGTPLVSGGKWDNKRDWSYRTCYAKYLTLFDIEQFRQIARQYAGFPKTPLKFYNQKTGDDSRYLEQYIMTGAGIKHADLDLLYACEECTYEEALEYNCWHLRFITASQLNCSLAYSLENPVPESDLNKHIDPIEADRACIMEGGGEKK